VKVPVRRKSLRETVAENRAALDALCDAAGRPRMSQTNVEAAIAARPVRTQLRKPSDPTVIYERDVLKAVWKLLAHHPRVAWITRINSGTAPMDFGNGRVAPIRFNYKDGISDLIGQMKDGRFIACEVKRPGEQPKPNQRAFLDEVRANRGVAFCAHSIDEALTALEAA
jgi:hypothetical protein